MRKQTQLIVAVVLTLTLLSAPGVYAAARLGVVSSGLLGAEYEPQNGLPDHLRNVAFSAGFSRKGDVNGFGIGVTKYLGDDEPHTNRPFAAARLGLLGEGAGITYGAMLGYSVSMGFLQLSPNVHYADGEYGLGLGAALQF